MSVDLVFYTNPMSRGRIVRWMLEEIGAPYRTEVVAYGPAMKTPAYLAINPMGKVPAITHGDTAVAETGAIIAYLADAFPDTELAPPLGARGDYYRWLFFSAGCIEGAYAAKGFGFEPTTPQDQGRAGFGSLAKVADVLDQALTARSYLVGDRFSAADVYVGAQIGFGRQLGLLETLPSLTAYLERLAARPAYQRAKAQDDALAAQTGT